MFRHNKEYLVKRVEAVEGDLIERNGENLVVPEGGFYVLGDNGQCSYDSRYWKHPFVMSDDNRTNKENITIREKASNCR